MLANAKHQHELALYFINKGLPCNQVTGKHISAMSLALQNGEEYLDVIG
jgi:hypothetical protein